ncbi:hypothetical protein GTP81_05050 [Rugamonas sp. FT107W]|uniref:DUF4864 domain-containing protein n=1 Tax=Duganella vulcania TaxID=2692166 RepID=A0A845HAJ4_9BURK|nr:hypothetical protein [Duganella vulcania]MYN16112.1 hypothetical protein [Duganella vulcania]
MKPLIALLLAAVSGAAPACQTPTPDGLRAAWVAVRAAALRDEPGASARLYQFPLQLLSAYQGDRPLRVDRAAFNEHYTELFGPEMQFRQDLKNTKDGEYFGKIDFDDKACRLKWPVRIHDYNFTYDQKAGWLVQSIYMPEAYGLFKDGTTAGIR